MILSTSDGFGGPLSGSFPLCPLMLNTHYTIGDKGFWKDIVFNIC